MNELKYQLMKRETNGLIDEQINEGRDELIVKVSMGTE